MVCFINKYSLLINLTKVYAQYSKKKKKNNRIDKRRETEKRLKNLKTNYIINIFYKVLLYRHKVLELKDILE